MTVVPIRPPIPIRPPNIIPFPPRPPAPPSSPGAGPGPLVPPWGGPAIPEVIPPNWGAANTAPPSKPTDNTSVDERIFDGPRSVKVRSYIYGPDFYETWFMPPHETVKRNGVGFTNLPIQDVGDVYGVRVCSYKVTSTVVAGPGQDTASDVVPTGIYIMGKNGEWNAPQATRPTNYVYHNGQWLGTSYESFINQIASIDGEEYPMEWEPIYPGTGFPAPPVLPAPPAYPRPSIPPATPSEPAPDPERKPMPPPLPSEPLPGQPPYPGVNPGPGPSPGPSPDPPPRPLPPPEVVPTPSPSPSPGPGPSPSPSPGPGQIPGRPVGPTPEPPPAITPPPVTPEWGEDFWGDVIGDPSWRPRPTLDGLAEITGKLEQKLYLMARPDAVPPVTGDSAKIAKILALLEVSTGADAYFLQGPCERGPEGMLLPPVEVPIPGSSDTLSAVLWRLDAIASLIQAHKNAGQPTCVRQRQGKPVTVILREDP